MYHHHIAKAAALTLCVLLLHLLFGLDGIWWAMTVAEVFALGLSILFLATQRKRYHYL